MADRSDHTPEPQRCSSAWQSQEPRPVYHCVLSVGHTGHHNAATGVNWASEEDLAQRSENRSGPLPTARDHAQRLHSRAVAGWPNGEAALVELVRARDAAVADAVLARVERMPRAMAERLNTPYSPSAQAAASCLLTLADDIAALREEYRNGR